MSKNKGLALIVVLWILVLLSIMAASFSLTIQRETVMTTGYKEKAEAVALAEAGINYAVLRLLSATEDKVWSSNHNVYEIEYEEARIRILISDESGKFALNQIKKEELVSVLNTFGLEEEQVESLSDAIIDWRDDDDEPKEFGAEKQTYSDLGLNYEPRNGAFQALEELQLVHGMTPDVYQKLNDVMSLYSSAPKIDPKSASKQVLMTLPDVTEEMVDEYMLLRAEQERNGEPVEQPEWYQGGAGKTEINTIISEAMVNGEIKQQIKAVIRMTSLNKDLPYEVLEWTESNSGQSLFDSQNDEWVIQ